MPVQTTIFPKANGGANTLSLFARTLDLALFASGWERAYLDSNANIGAVGGSPGFGRGYSNNVSAGVAVYRAPNVTLGTASTTSRWLMQLEWRYGAAPSFIGLFVTLATNVNGATGALTGAGPTRGQGTIVISNTDNDKVISASEYGFSLVGQTDAPSNFALGVERRRSVGNSLSDAMVQWGIGNNTGWTGGAGSRCVVRTWTLGEEPEREMAYLGAAVGAVYTAPSTQSTSDNNLGYPLGPFPEAGGLNGVLRHFQAWAPGDAVGAANQSVEVEGQGRQHYCLDTVALGAPFPAGVRLLVPRA